MPNNNENKVLNVPNLRFPEFSGEWKETSLSSYAKKITKKNKGNIISNVLCNSANLGIIPQSDYFDRDIANNENTNTYYVIENGDFVYNPRKSVTAPYGPVNMYLGDKTGIISPLYLCFSVKDIYCDFLLHWFKGNAWHRYVYSHGDTGVRFDRVSIKDDIFLNMPIKVPVYEEQIRISKLLRAIDERIASQNKIIDNLQSLISGLNDFLHLQVGGLSTSFEELGTSYSGLSGKGGDDFGKGKPYITYLNIYSNSIVNEEQVDYVVIGDNEKQNTLLYGDLLFTLSSETPDEVGIGAVYLGEGDKYYLNSFCFGLHMTAANKVYSPYLAYLVSNSIFRKFIYPLAQGSTRFNLHKNDFMKKKFLLPTFENQKEIARTLNTLSSKLETERKLLLNYQEQKQYLLGSMFI